MRLVFSVRKLLFLLFTLPDSPLLQYFCAMLKKQKNPVLSQSTSPNDRNATDFCLEQRIFHLSLTQLTSEPQRTIMRLFIAYFRSGVPLW